MYRSLPSERSLIPPARLRLSQWIEREIVLPGVRLWPYQRAIADAISDPEIERVTLVKGVRLGFSTLLTGAIGAFVANEPAPILALLPTEADCRNYIVSDVESVATTLCIHTQEPLNSRIRRCTDELF